MRIGLTLLFLVLVLTILITAIAKNGPAVNAAEAKKPQVEKSNMSSQIRVYSVEQKKYILTDRVEKSEDEWRKILTPQQFEVTRKKGTERAFTGEYWKNHQKGIYQCVACGNDLYTSDTKFESGTGWPSFWAPVAKENIIVAKDNSLFMERDEVLCARCSSHLGHVFDDGPPPTGLRYCMNSAALKFVKLP